MPLRILLARKQTKIMRMNMMSVCSCCWSSILELNKLSWNGLKENLLALLKIVIMIAYFLYGLRIACLLSKSHKRGCRSGIDLH